MINYSTIHVMSRRVGSLFPRSATTSLRCNWQENIVQGWNLATICDLQFMTFTRWRVNGSHSAGCEAELHLFSWCSCVRKWTGEHSDSSSRLCRWNSESRVRTEMSSLHYIFMRLIRCSYISMVDCFSQKKGERWLLTKWDRDKDSVCQRFISLLH